MKKILIAASALSLLAACGSGEPAEKTTEAPAADAAASSATDTAASSATEAAAATPAAGVQVVTFKVDNATDNILTHLFVSPAASNSWNNDILGEQTAAPGATIEVTIDDGVESCMYDFRAHFDDDTDLDVRGVNVCELEGKTVTVSE